MSDRLRFNRDIVQNPEHSETSEEKSHSKRLMLWFRANMTTWMYEYANNKYVKLQQGVQQDIRLDAFKRHSITESDYGEVK